MNLPQNQINFIAFFIDAAFFILNLIDLNLFQHLGSKKHIDKASGSWNHGKRGRGRGSFRGNSNQRGRFRGSYSRGRGGSFSRRKDEHKNNADGSWNYNGLEDWSYKNGEWNYNGAIPDNNWNGKQGTPDQWNHNQNISGAGDFYHSGNTASNTGQFTGYNRGGNKQGQLNSDRHTNGNAKTRGYNRGGRNANFAGNQRDYGGMYGGNRGGYNKGASGYAQAKNTTAQQSVNDGMAGYDMTSSNYGGYGEQQMDYTDGYSDPSGYQGMGDGNHYHTYGAGNAPAARRGAFNKAQPGAAPKADAHSFSPAPSYNLPVQQHDKWNAMPSAAQAYSQSYTDPLLQNFVPGSMMNLT